MQRRIREKISKSVKELWNDKIYRDNQVKKHIGKKFSEETRKKMSISGGNRKGVKLSEDTKILISIRTKEGMKKSGALKKISILQKGKILSEEHKNKIKKTMLKGIKDGRIINSFTKGPKHVNTKGIKFLPQRVKKMSIAQKKLWDNNEYKERILRLQRIGLQKPTKPEKNILVFIKEKKLTFEYIGDGKFWITSNQNNKKFNPDFLDKHNKKIIEYDGKYWHSNKKNRDKLRNRTYLNQGYNLLIINEDDFKHDNYKNLIMEFAK